MKPFTGTLVVLGNAEHVDVAEWGDQPVLLFVTDVEGCRSAGSLLRQKVQLVSMEEVKSAVAEVMEALRVPHPDPEVDLMQSRARTQLEALLAGKAGG